MSLPEKVAELEARIAVLEAEVAELIAVQKNQAYGKSS